MQTKRPTEDLSRVIGFSEAADLPDQTDLAPMGPARLPRAIRQAGQTASDGSVPLRRGGQTWK